MAKARHKAFLEKSIASAISAIEVYNKPDFKYREETFSILMINAWELLLKAKIIKDSNNNLKSIYAKEKKKNKDGITSKKVYLEKNRSGNPVTIGIKKSMEKTNIPEVLKENLNLLIEIRDNSIHFINKNPLISEKVLGIGAANLKSYVKLFSDWFDYDLSQYNFYLIPISFFPAYELKSVSLNRQPQQLKNLIKYISQKEEQYPSNEREEYNISLKIETKFSKSSITDAVKVKCDPNASLKVRYDEEEQFINKYPMDYKDLIDKLKERYGDDFKQTRKFYEIKRPLEENDRYCGKRFLDVVKKTGTLKKYYSTEILKEFDKHYTKKR